MDLTEEEIDQFIRLYEKSYSERLSRQDAYIRAAQFLKLIVPDTYKEHSGEDSNTK